MNTNVNPAAGFDDGKTISAYDREKINAAVNNSSHSSDGYLIILDASKRLRTVKLDKDTVTIGRAEDNDIVLNSKMVSKHHGIICHSDGQFFYRDNGSLNGTCLNMIMLYSREHMPSSLFSLGNDDVMKIESQVDKNDPENTIMIFSDQEVTENNWAYINLKNYSPCLYIGRDVPEGHLKIDSMQVSKVHACIFQSEGGYYIQDNESLNGVTLNGQRIIRSLMLSNNDVIIIGSTKMIFINGFLVFNSVPNGVKLDVQDISRVVQGKKVILDHVSLTVNPCELVAIIGGSGAGKSTFMNCLNGFEPATSGHVIMDGLDLVSNYSTLKHRIGNVPQKDELHDFLRVEDELMFTAKLRLSKDVSGAEIKNRVNEVLNIMDLYDHRRTLIKKLSGGQKKRVSIAMELVSDPDIFFLDEPTSGLDPETETALMYQLKHLSSKIGKTIVVITHTLQNIHLFDKIIFLAPGGRLCYYGTPDNALSFFNVKALPDAYERVKKNAEHYINKYSAQI